MSIFKKILLPILFLGFIISGLVSFIFMILITKLTDDKIEKIDCITKKKKYTYDDTNISNN